MADTVRLNVTIASCPECPFFATREVKPWLSPAPLYEYSCRRATRVITPDDGIKPPPSWCPLRAAANEGGEADD